MEVASPQPASNSVQRLYEINRIEILLFTFYPFNFKARWSLPEAI